MIFKEYVKNICINNAKQFKEVFIDFQYKIYSEAFSVEYYTINAIKGNYLHLTGLNTNLKANEFFDKCFNRTLTINDFNFKKKNMSERQVRKVVKSKLKVLPQLMTLFNKSLKAEENFTKGLVCCAFAATDNVFTIGFSKGKFSRPKSLLNKNFLTHGKDVYKIEKISRINNKTIPCKNDIRKKYIVSEKVLPNNKAKVKEKSKSTKKKNTIKGS